MKKKRDKDTFEESNGDPHKNMYLTENNNIAI